MAAARSVCLAPHVTPPPTSVQSAAKRGTSPRGPACDTCRPPAPHTKPIRTAADFSEFLKVIITQKAKQAGQDDESDTGEFCQCPLPPPFPSRR